LLLSSSSAASSYVADETASEPPAERVSKEVYRHHGGDRYGSREDDVRTMPYSTQVSRLQSVVTKS